MSLLCARRFDTLARISIEQSEDHFHAHVEFAEDTAVGPGDRVSVHGGPISVPFGGSAVFERTATIEVAGPLRRAWTRAAAYFDMKELYEVSFSPGRL